MRRPHAPGTSTARLALSVLTEKVSVTHGMGYQPIYEYHANPSSIHLCSIIFIEYQYIILKISISTLH